MKCEHETWQNEIYESDHRDEVRMNMKYGRMRTMSEEVRVKCEHEAWQNENYESDDREEVRVKVNMKRGRMRTMSQTTERK